MRYQFIADHQRQFPTVHLCRLLQVSPAGYYAWCTRPESARSRADRELTERIRAIHKASRATYGWRRVHAELCAQGHPCSRKRVARLMRQAGLQARRRRPRRVRTTDSRHGFDVAPNLLAEAPEVTGPDQVWVSDITYLRTDEGWLYLATVLDLYSRRIVGWSLQATLERSLTLDALAMAVGRRHPRPGLLHHSDRGSQYACHDYQDALRRHGMLPSMSRRGDPYDNAAQESFFGRLKEELPRERWATRAEARREVFEYLEVFYNRHRRHSSLHYLPPVDFEHQHAQQAA